MDEPQLAAKAALHLGIERVRGLRALRLRGHPARLVDDDEPRILVHHDQLRQRLGGLVEDRDLVADRQRHIASPARLPLT